MWCFLLLIKLFKFEAHGVRAGSCLPHDVVCRCIQITNHRFRKHVHFTTMCRELIENTCAKSFRKTLNVRLKLCTKNNLLKTQIYGQLKKLCFVNNILWINIYYFRINNSLSWFTDAPNARLIQAPSKYEILLNFRPAIERPGLESQRSRKRHFFHRKIFKFFKYFII